MPGSHQDHFQRLTRLLDMECEAASRRALARRRATSPREAEAAGEALVELVLRDVEAGLGGRFIISLAKPGGSPLPWTRLEVGSPVILSPNGPGSDDFTDGTRGVVCERGEHAIRVALGRLPDALESEDAWRIDAADDDVAARRQREALSRAAAAKGNPLAQLRGVLLGLRPPRFHPAGAGAPPATLLDSSQAAAVAHALQAEDLALIHGPPGTGKTTALVELISRSTARGEKVLACAPSNLAVDNLLERLLRRGQRAVRLGHPARVLPELRANTLDLLVEEHADVRLARKLVREAMAMFRDAGKYKRARPVPGARREQRAEARSLLDDARRLEAQAVEQILDTADILCATTTALDTSLIGERMFDLAVIDEACQSTEPGCWIPLAWCRKVVLAGDHWQLPPTVISEEAARGGFAQSLFERLAQGPGEIAARRLDVQYRMHRVIMGFSSGEFYSGTLQAHSSVAEHRLADLPGVADLPATRAPLEFIDTAGAGYDEEVEPGGESRLNPHEASLVARKARALVDWGVPAGGIAVITPYAAQARWLRGALAGTDIEIDSVDGFQGREKEAVLISLVRSNPRGEIGFLSDTRRMNVAMTRARRKLVVVGDSATLGRHEFYRRFLEYCEQWGAYRTVWEEPHAG